MSDKTTYYQKNKGKLLNRAKEYYENNKERLREQARNKYRELSDETKYKKREYGRNKYQNMSEEKNKNVKNTKKIIAKQRNEHKKFHIFFFFTCYKNGAKSFDF